MDVGQKIIIVDIMSRKSKKINNDKLKILKVIELLKFASSFNDDEILKSTVESVIEILEEQINE